MLISLHVCLFFVPTNHDRHPTPITATTKSHLNISYSSKYSHWISRAEWSNNYINTARLALYLKVNGEAKMTTQAEQTPTGIGKVFYQMQNIGKSKYVVNTHNGIDKHKDDSPFYGARIFDNKKKLAACLADLIKQGYVEHSGIVLAPNNI